MTAIDKFRKLAADISQLSGCLHNNVWGDAQAWKDRAKEVILDVFSEVSNTCDNLLNRLNGVFVPQPSYVSADGTSSPSIPDLEQKQIFQDDICAAQDIMDECCREFRRLSTKFR